MKKKYDTADSLQDFWFQDISNFEYWRNLRKNHI